MLTVLFFSIVSVNAQDASSLTSISSIGSLIPFSPSQFQCTANDTSNDTTCDQLTSLSNNDFVCNEDVGACTLSCNSTADCTQYTPGLGITCDLMNEYCVPFDGSCNSTDECPTILGSECDIINEVCTKGQLDNLPTCSSSSDCSSGNVCYETPGLCIPACSTDSDCSELQLAGATCNVSSSQCQFSCSSDSDCVGELANQCNTDMGVCYYGCDTDDDCILGTKCQSNLCLPNYQQCAQDSDCDDGLTNTCYDTGIYKLCIFTCNDDTDCNNIPGTVCRSMSDEASDAASNVNSTVLVNNIESGLPFGLPVDIPSGLASDIVNKANISTCQPGTVSCKKDGDCAEGFKCNTLASIPGVGQFIDGHCYPACEEGADCTASGLKGAPCKSVTIKAPITKQTLGSIKYCDITQIPDPTPTPTESTGAPTNVPSTSPTDDGETVDGGDVHKTVAAMMGILFITIWI